MKPDQPQSPIDLKRLAALHLREDFVLVRPEPPPKDGSIVIPAECREGADGKYGLRHGVVVACSRGDRILSLVCPKCGLIRDAMISRLERHRGSQTIGYSCLCECGEKMDVVDVTRRKLSVKLGDRVLYWRSPANEARLRIGKTEELYEILHEEQHIAAVLE